MNDEAAAASTESKPNWQPLDKIDRRVVGVLVEKAKTTPDQYPLSLNAVKAGCNQKSNRDPLMDLDEDDVAESLERLRGMGAVTEVYGSGRVSRFRHHMYDWLGVDRVELAVMTELLLRGAQTEGELRGRAARMEPIRDVAELRPVLASLRSKGLVISLTPEGRGHVVTHALYPPQELEALRRQYSAGRSGPARHMEEGPRQESVTQWPATPASSTSGGVSTEEIDALRGEVAELRAQLADMREQVSQLATSAEGTDEAVQRINRELGL